MTTVKSIKGESLGYVRLHRGEHVSFIFGDNWEHLCEISMADDGTPLVMVDTMKVVKTIRELTGGDD